LAIAKHLSGNIPEARHPHIASMSARTFQGWFFFHQRHTNPGPGEADLAQLHSGYTPSSVLKHTSSARASLDLQLCNSISKTETDLNTRLANPRVICSWKALENMDYTEKLAKDLTSSMNQQAGQAKQNEKFLWQSHPQD